jgi:transposase
MRIAAEGSIRSLFRLNGGRLRSCSSVASLKKNVTDELRQIRKIEKLDLTDDVAPLLALSEAIRTYLEDLDKRLEAMAAENPVCRRFLEIPGVGPICALSFYAAIEDPSRFRRNADVGAYLGMVPRVRQTGQNMTKLRISKMGDTMTRSYLTIAAQQHLLHGKSALSAWGALLADRLRKRGVKVAVARKLAVTMLAMWKSGENYDPHRGTPNADLAAEADSSVI